MNAANAFVADEPVPKPPMTPPPASAMEEAKDVAKDIWGRPAFPPHLEIIAAALAAAERRGYDAAIELLVSTGTFHDAVRLLDANREAA